MDSTTVAGTTTTGTTDVGMDSSTSSEEASSSGDIECPPSRPFAQLMMAEDAIIEAPGTLVPSWGDLNGDPQVFLSLVADDGLIHFDFEIPCEGTYHLWAVTWDRWHGTGLSCGEVINPDSVHVFPDDNAVAERRWTWGCNTCDLPDAVWAWHRAQEFESVGCSVVDLSYDWGRGTHRLSFLNEDPGTPGMGVNPPDAAAIAAVAISNDPDFSPDTLYAP